MSAIQPYPMPAGFVGNERSLLKVPPEYAGRLEGPAVGAWPYVLVSCANFGQAGQGSTIELWSRSMGHDTLAGRAWLDNGTSSAIIVGRNYAAQLWYLRGVMINASDDRTRAGYIHLELLGCDVPLAGDSQWFEARNGDGNAFVHVPQGAKLQEVSLLPNLLTAEAAIFPSGELVPPIVTLSTPAGVAETLQPKGLAGGLDIEITGFPRKWLVTWGGL